MSAFYVLGILLCGFGVVYACRGFLQKCKHRLLNGLMIAAAGAVQFTRTSWWVRIGVVVLVALFIVAVDVVKVLLGRRRRDRAV